MNKKVIHKASNVVYLYNSIIQMYYSTNAANFTTAQENKL